MKTRICFIFAFLLFGQNLFSQDSTLAIAFTKKSNSTSGMFVLHPNAKVIINLIDNQRIKGKYLSVDSQNIYVYYNDYDSFGRKRGNYIDTVALDSIAFLKTRTVGLNILGGFLLLNGLPGVGMGIVGVATSVGTAYGFILLPLSAIVLLSSAGIVYTGALLLKQNRYISDRNHYTIFKVVHKDLPYYGRVNRTAKKNLHH